ncbi:MAG: hypothetical protein IJY20_08385 [Clostridia bacterium]|nr:hypothetical protein [Clostridia bacterium]
MNNTSILRSLLCLLLLALLLCTGCGGQEAGDAVTLSFKSAARYADLKPLNGKTVTINGYMATSSPVDGSFMFLMNLPYQSCPFCVPNTSQLSNTMEVYPKNGDSFAYTNQAIRVVGRLVVAEREDEPFTDMYGYEFNYKIVDATYTIIRAEELSANMGLWQQIAESDVITEVYEMYDYVRFLCAWNTYFVNTYTDASGKVHTGYFLYPSDALAYITTDGARWNYGYKDGYFDSLVQKIEAVDKTAFADLVQNVRDAEALAARALSDLQGGKYSTTSEPTYVEKFDSYDYIYTLDNGEELKAQMNALYGAFSDWLGAWEL